MAVSKTFISLIIVMVTSVTFTFSEVVTFTPTNDIAIGDPGAESYSSGGGVNKGSHANLTIANFTC